MQNDKSGAGYGNHGGDDTYQQGGKGDSPGKPDYDKQEGGMDVGFDDSMKGQDEVDNQKVDKG